MQQNELSKILSVNVTVQSYLHKHQTQLRIVIHGFRTTMPEYGPLLWVHTPWKILFLGYMSHAQTINTCMKVVPVLITELYKMQFDPQVILS